jgi:hypothetical protein
MLAFPAPAMLAAGLTYYVATNGSDSNNGRSTNTPFKTIQKPATVAAADDTVNIWAGTYREPADLTTGGPIRILPAVRPDWSDRFGLLARGCFFARITFANGKPQRIAITSNREGRLRLANPFPVCRVLCETGTARAVEARLIELDTQPGARLYLASEPRT